MVNLARSVHTELVEGVVDGRLLLRLHRPRIQVDSNVLQH